MWTVIIITVAIVVCLTVFSHAKYQRSVMATLAELFLRLTEKRYTDKQLNDVLEQKRKSGDSPYNLPKNALRGSNVTRKDFSDMQVFYVNANVSCRTAVVYLHGGAYVRPPRKWHLKFIKKLSKKTETPFIVPIYPKAPNKSAEEVYRLMKSFYLSLRASYDKIILMGDSSGGGLALGLSQYFIKEGIEQPDRLILLSPWLDVTFSNPDIKKYEKTDPIVFVENDILIGKIWANKLSVYDYRVSPIYGQMQGLKNVEIFCGTREVLYPDCRLLKMLMEENGVDVEFYEGLGLNHVYPIYPIPEAKAACDVISELIINVRRSKKQKLVSLEEQSRIRERLKKNS